MPKPVPQTVNQQASDLLQPGLGSTSVNDKDQQGSPTHEMDTTLLIHICIVFSIFLQPPKQIAHLLEMFLETQNIGYV